MLTMNPPTLLDSIPFQIQPDQLQNALRIKDGSPYAAHVLALAKQAQALARPKALYCLAFIDAKSDSSVVIDGVEMRSRVLRVNLEATHRVFPSIATCGVELEAWSAGFSDMLERYWADTIKEMALRAATQAIVAHLTERYHPAHLSAMHPGSLEDWPLSAQPALFSLLGDPQAAIGVRLTESLLMLPTKSVSGIYFTAQESFASCQLCPRQACPSRKAPYEADLYARKYAAAA